MNRRLLLAIAFSIAAPIAVAQQLPPPEEPAPAKPPLPPQGPALAAPQNQPAVQAAAPQAAAAQPANPKAGVRAGKPPEFFQARRAALKARKEAQMERMRGFREARYQDWHQRYLADTPVREEYYRALGSYYESESAFANIRSAYYYAWGPPIVLPIIPIYYSPFYDSPYYNPHYGNVVYWAW